MSTGKLNFGVARIFASFNDTFVHVTDLRLAYSARGHKARKLTETAVAKP